MLDPGSGTRLWIRGKGVTTWKPRHPACLLRAFEGLNKADHKYIEVAEASSSYPPSPLIHNLYQSPDPASWNFTTHAQDFSESQQARAVLDDSGK